MSDELATSVPRQARASELVWLATGSAAVASVARVTAAFIRHSMLHQFTWTSSDLGWMTLVGNAIIFAGVALLVLSVGRRVRLGSLAASTGVFAFLTTLSVMLLITEIWQYASLALALGITYQSVQLTRRNPVRLMVGVKRVAAIAGGLALIVAGRSATARGEMVGSAPASPPTDAPSVLLIILDTVRASSMSLYGYAQRTTPILERFAREGVVFDRAVATAPWTLPSHCSLFTGRDAQKTSCRWMAPLDDGPTTVAEILRAQGFRTGGFVANHFYTTRETGLARGFDTWRDFRRTWKELFCSTVLVQTGIVRSALWGETRRQRAMGLLKFRLRGDPKPEHDRKDAATVNREFLQWLDEAPSRPFFAFLNYFDAHEPYLAPPPFAKAFAPGDHLRDQYDGGIAYIDQQLGALFNELKRRGQLDRTVIVVASDHGELFGEHALFSHGNALYWPLLHVPLVIRYPQRVPAGIHVATTVSLRDVPSTILDLVGKQDLRIGGASLVPTWHDSTGVPVSASLAFLEKGSNWWGKEPARFDSLASITVESWQFIKAFGGREELFDLSSDPLGLADVAEHDTNGARRTALRDALRRATALPSIASPDRPE